MKLLKRTAIVLLIACLTLCGLSGCGSKPPQMEDFDFSGVTLDACTDTDQVTEHVKIVFRDYGTVIVRLFPETAPLTVENFQSLVADGFYNGVPMHRIIKNFMIQGGDPDGDGVGGSEKTIKGEFEANGVENNLRHMRGVISMARTSQSYNSASSQFFIMHSDRPGTYYGLDGNYAAFGAVVCGLEVVDAIANCQVTYDAWGNKSSPVEPIYIESASFVNVK